jgi:translation initiation factor IF-3
LRQFKQPRRESDNRQVNAAIIFRELRVIGEQGQLGVMSKDDALRLAEKQNTDLVLINASAKPAIAKLLNANKYFYEQKRKEKEAAKKQRESQIVVKEMQFRLGIDQHDFETKCNNIKRFLEKNNKVKCVIRYKGRENANKQVGFEIMDRIVEFIETCDWETKPSINGNRMIGVLMRKE